MSGGFDKPNYTQAPNAFFDDVLPQITSLAELKVTLAVIRQTFGFHREERELSITRLAALTGLHRDSVVEGVKLGLARGTLARRKHGQGFLYRAQVVGNSDPQPVGDSDYRESRHVGDPDAPKTPTSRDLPTRPVGNSDPQPVGDSDPIERKDERKQKETVGVSTENGVRRRDGPPPPQEEGSEGTDVAPAPSPHRERAVAHASALGRRVKRRTRKVDGEEMQRYLKRFANDCMLALEDGLPERMVAAVIERIDERWEDVVLNWPGALKDVRERTEEEAVNERGASFWEAHEAGRDKPCRPEWYVAACGGAPAEYEAMIGRGMLHSEILEAAHA